ncbi:MAG: 50S ribosomal protein L23 [Nitrospinae bacterium]|nr:50S ribosomal protein L23 [Nitrospinota bacterium]
MKTDHFEVIRSPLLTEKATDLREKYNKICFEINPRANKKQVSEAVEKIFNVKVADVKIVNTKPKPKRLGKSNGFRIGFKKAIVSLKEGSKIEIFERIN